MTANGPLFPKPSSRAFATVQFSTAADGLSDPINITGLTLSSIQMSTAWTAAKLFVYGNVDGSTSYYPMFEQSSSDYLHIAATVIAVDTLFAFDPAFFAGVQHIQLASINSASTAAVAQDATRTIKLGLSEYVNAN